MIRYIYLLAVAMLSAVVSFAQESWPDSIYTALNAPYLTNQEKVVIVEMNKVRSNPKRYVQEVLVPFLSKFTGENNGRLFIASDGRRIVSNEGRAVVEECIAELNNTAPMSVISPSEGMSRAAQMLASDQRNSGRMGHETRNGSKPWDRAAKFGQWLGYYGENVDYGNSMGEDIVLSLVVDDGVDGRGHRHNTLNPNFRVAGVCIGSHAGYRNMCVIDFASGYIEKNRNK